MASDSVEPRPFELVVLGNPGSRRLVSLDLALEQSGMPPARVVPYLEYLCGRARLADLIREGNVLRIESPGQNFEVERAILADGAELLPPDSSVRIDRAELDRLSFDHGRILGPKQWYLGFSRLLTRIEQDRASCPVHAVMNAPGSIGLLFDKTRCHARLIAEGLPCPRALGPIVSYDALRDRMRETRVGRVFVKLNCGSSASGVVAFESNGRRVQGFTTTELVEPSNGRGPVLYNSRRIRRIEDERAIARLIDALALEDVHVEQWVPKAGLDGHTFDVRVVVIAGRPEHAVVRMSRSPMTNLHLKNRRADVALLRSRMSVAAWESLLVTCRRVACVFPDCQYLGVDVAVLPGFRRHVVLEVNAFGDHLPGVIDASGRDCYTAELDALAISATGASR